MSRVGALLTALVSGALCMGCVRDALVDCGDGRACPAGTVCATLDANQKELCVVRADLDACGDPFASCSQHDGEPGSCYESSAGVVCLPGGCGNEIVDPGEACDDGNGIVGDGCSSSCRSDETCGNGVVDPVREESGIFVANESCDDGNLTSHDGCSSTCMPETPRWELLEMIAPDKRFDSSAAYDSDRRRMVVFGGAIQTQLRVPRGDTYEFDGEGWMKMPTPITPSARWGGAMAFDPIHHRVVMFGGRTTGLPFSDTWQWDGTRWSSITSAMTPPARAEASLVYDPDSQRLLLYGGEGEAGALGDGWELDGDVWSPLTTALPPARFDHAMAFDPLRNVMVMVSGTPLETWERVGGVWSASAIPTPAEVRNGGLAFDGTGLITFTNVTNSTTGVTQRWDGTAWTRPVLISAAPGRTFAAMVADTVRHKVSVFGGVRIAIPCGIGCYALDDTTWEWDGATWTEVVPETPGSRTFHAAAFDTRRGSLFFFGGGITLLGNDTTRDLWEQRGTHWHHYSDVGAPQARSHVAMAYDAKRDELLLYGGVNDSWTWHDGVWTSNASVPGRLDAALAYDPVREEVVMFGGRIANATDETWVWNGSVWTQRTPPVSPPARWGAKLVWDPMRRSLLLFGGDLTAGSLSDLWAWDGTTWTDVTPMHSPPPRASYGLLWHGTRRSLLLFAGASNQTTAYSDTWELRKDTWEQLPIPPPDTRQGHSLTPLADGTGALMYGGSTGTIVSDQLWRLRWESGLPSEICVGDDTDGDGLAGCADPDCWSYCTPLCPPATTCEPTWPRCGDGDCAPVENCVLCPMDCGAC